MLLHNVIILSDFQWKVIWRQITAGVWAFSSHKQEEPVMAGKVWTAPTLHFQQSWRPQQQTKQQTSLKEEEEEEEKEEAEVPTLVPTVKSWWTLLWRKDSVLEAAGRKTQKTTTKLRGKIKGKNYEAAGMCEEMEGEAARKQTQEESKRQIRWLKGFQTKQGCG